MSLMAYFGLSFIPRDVLDEIWDLTESVSEVFPTYFVKYTIVDNRYTLSPSDYLWNLELPEADSSVVQMHLEEYTYQAPEINRIYILGRHFTKHSYAQSYAQS